MDPLYVKALKEAKQLFDDGIFSEEEFVQEKKRIRGLRDNNKPITGPTAKTAQEDGGAKSTAGAKGADGGTKRRGRPPKAVGEGAKNKVGGKEEEGGGKSMKAETAQEDEGAKDTEAGATRADEGTKRWGRPKSSGKGAKSKVGEKRAREEEDEEEIYEVEKVVAERMIGRQRQFRVRWQGFPPSGDTWEPAKLFAEQAPMVAMLWESEKGSKAGSEIPSGGASPVKTPGKKRGRPPKAASQGEDKGSKAASDVPSGGASLVKTSGKRGRPPKSASQGDKGSKAGSDSPVKTSGKRGRPRKDASEKQEQGSEAGRADASGAASPAKVPNKMGSPRKLLML